MYDFKRIPDVEVETTRTEVSTSCLGLIRTKADVMITITHEHGTDIAEHVNKNNITKDSYYPGKVYLSLSFEQANELRKQLDIPDIVASHIK